MSTTRTGNRVSIPLLAVQTTANSPPANSAAFKALWKSSSAGVLSEGFDTRLACDAVLYLYADRTAAGSTAISCYARLWGYNREADAAFPLGVGSSTNPADDKGLLNRGLIIGETTSRKVRHAEPVQLFRHVDGIYLEIKTLLGDIETTGWNAVLVGREG